MERTPGALGVPSSPTSPDYESKGNAQRGLNATTAPTAKNIEGFRAGNDGKLPTRTSSNPNLTSLTGGAATFKLPVRNLSGSNLSNAAARELEPLSALRPTDSERETKHSSPPQSPTHARTANVARSTLPPLPQVPDLDDTPICDPVIMHRVLHNLYGPEFFARVQYFMNGGWTGAQVDPLEALVEPMLYCGEPPPFLQRNDPVDGTKGNTDIKLNDLD